MAAKSMRILKIAMTDMSEILFERRFMASL